MQKKRGARGIGHQAWCIDDGLWHGVDGEGEECEGRRAREYGGKLEAWHKLKKSKTRLGISREQS